jgi:hypothetical protein
MATRFLSNRDIDNVFTRVNKELIGDLVNNKDGIINQTVKVYKISAYDTATNLYGEAAGGKRFKPGVNIACLIESEDFDFNTDEFGPDLRQSATFSFLRQTLIDLSFVVEIGDIIDWNYAHWEINGINENQLVGGQFDNNWAALCSSHLIRRSNLQIERMRSI